MRAEEQWMEEISFPALKEHRALHAEVLSVLHKSQARAMAGDLTLADTNEEAANLLALQTRQSLAQSSLSLANQAEQSVLNLIR